MVVEARVIVQRVQEQEWMQIAAARALMGRGRGELWRWKRREESGRWRRVDAGCKRPQRRWERGLGKEQRRENGTMTEDNWKKKARRDYVGVGVGVHARALRVRLSLRVTTTRAPVFGISPDLTQEMDAFIPFRSARLRHLVQEVLGVVHRHV